MNVTSPRRRNICIWLSVAAALILTYVASFVLVQHSATFTFLVHGNFYTVRVCYFSHHTNANRWLFAFYWPLHRQGSEDLLALKRALTERDEGEELARRKLRRFYIRDIEVCRNAGLAGLQAK